MEFDTNELGVLADLISFELDFYNMAEGPQNEEEQKEYDTLTSILAKLRKEIEGN